MAREDIFIEPAVLSTMLGEADVVVIDGSYFLSTMGRDAAAEYARERIPGAIRFDIDSVKDTTTPLPHMLPSADQFAAQVGALGVSDTDRIVVYDGLGLFSAPRVRWTFRSFGARDVKILDGGFPRWKTEGFAVETGPPVQRAPARFNARFDAGAVANLADVERVLADGSAQMLDARPAERFQGTAPEPRPGLPSGHMPGAHNLPFAAIIEDGRLKDIDALLAALAAAGIDPDKPVITTCGSGVSAAILSTALEMAGKPAKALYDGSWAEWASRPDAPIAQGPA